MLVRVGTVLLVASSLASFSHGKELTVKLTPAELAKVPYVQPLVAPGATCASANDVLGLVAVGQKVEKQAQVSLFKLDAQGKPAGAAVVIKPAKPATLAQRTTYPLATVFHPSLPLLYVWQDVERLPGDPVPADEPAWKDFDHLHIYAVDAAAPELLVSLCRGTLFHTGVLSGTLGLDAANGRLYVPNLRFGDKNPPEKGSGVGWFALGGDGLPILGDEEPAKPEAVAAPAAAAGARAARAAALRAAFAANKPIGAFRHTPPATYGFHEFPSGAGYVFGSRDVFLTCGPFGPVSWNTADRRARAQVFLMPINFTAYYVTRLAAHPTLPAVFVSIVGYPYVHRVEHAEGYVTLVPQVVTLDGATIKTPPVVMTKRNLVAFGGPGAIYLASIDAAGKFKDEKGTVTAIAANPTSVDGLAWSEKFDRLYIAVEKAP